mmetsp:Transcript_7685/g.16900  ORF Transcript_7685/g.16900 Transcript_7685/m.16900 type:complete len:214 (+) Transcript_7685:104-745(+)|eukprot:CAMPEP_0178436794 /NCGR_PEP_ID=MMETSP0689_2-20121128/34628_1 /TAXON_ID=160604 /ORGANISM="Amphidinium massartii, Strain CS-259" /LENGTH=213 /DNA_ID=CAMNT_0020058911 /DNA_START=89 /DNA_END=730 /DNA_ORIENTATION=-
MPSRCGSRSSRGLRFAVCLAFLSATHRELRAALDAVAFAGAKPRHGRQSPGMLRQTTRDRGLTIRQAGIPIIGDLLEIPDYLARSGTVETFQMIDTFNFILCLVITGFVGYETAKQQGWLTWLQKQEGTRKLQSDEEWAAAVDAFKSSDGAEAEYNSAKGFGNSGKGDAEATPLQKRRRVRARGKTPLEEAAAMDRKSLIPEAARKKASGSES